MSAVLQCRVRPGAILAHHGREYVGGEEVALAREVALAVAHLVDEVVGPDTVRRIAAPDAVDELRDRLDRHRPHERVSLLQQTRAHLAGQLEEVDRLIAGELAAVPKVAAPVVRGRATKAERSAVPTAGDPSAPPTTDAKG